MSWEGGIEMATTKISPQFQIVIPKEVRKKLHLSPRQAPASGRSADLVILYDRRLSSREIGRLCLLKCRCLDVKMGGSVCSGGESTGRPPLRAVWAQMPLIAFVTAPVGALKTIPGHLSEPTIPPGAARARVPDVEFTFLR